MASKFSSSLFFLTLFLITSEAKDFLVGGSTNAWTIPSSTSDSLNKWAETNRFQIGDSLVWRYDGEKDSVLQVSKKDYLSCNTSSPIVAYKDGATVVRLHRSGAYYFIAGAEGACEKGEKMVVVVMTERHGLQRLSPAAAPSPVAFGGPAVAPSSGGGHEMVVKKGLLGALVVVGMIVI